MKMLLRWLLRLIGPTLLLLFLASSDVGQLVAILRQAHVGSLLFSLVLIFPFLIIKGWRWRHILRELAIAIPLHTATGLYAVGVYLGSVTPGQSGDLVKAWYLRRRGHTLAPGLLSVVIDRLFDLIVMAFLAIFGIFALGHLLPDQRLQTGLVVAMGGGFVLLLVLLVAPAPRQWLLTDMLPRLLPQRLHTSLERWNTQLATLAMHPRMVLPALAASLLSAFFTFWRLWLLFVAIEVMVPLYVVVGASALIAIVQVLPISVAGVGVRDAVLIAVLSAPAYGYSQEQALSLSALFLLLTIEQIVVGFVVSFWYPLARQQVGVHTSDAW